MPSGFKGRRHPYYVPWFGCIELRRDHFWLYASNSAPSLAERVAEALSASAQIDYKLGRRSLRYQVRIAVACMAPLLLPSYDTELLSWNRVQTIRSYPALRSM